MTRPAGTGRQVVMVAPFAESPKATTSARVIPLARALAARGHRVTVLVPPYDNPGESRSRREGGAIVRTLVVPGAIPEASPLQAIAQPVLAARVAAAAMALEPDVVHLFKPKAVSGLAHAILAARRRLRGDPGPALVVDTDDWEGDGGWNEYEAYPWWQRAAVNAQEWWGIGAADAITAASRTLEAQAWSRGQPPARVAYLPNGLDDADYPGWWGPSGPGQPGRDEVRARLHLGNGPVVVLYTRFFEFQPSRALATIRAVRARVPGATLLVVGAGKFGQERALATLAANEGEAGAITLAGWQAVANLPGLLRAADVAIALADDNLANRAKCSVKLLQLMRLGVPVVADATGEQANYLAGSDTGAPGEAGVLVPPGDVTAMAVAVASLLSDPVRRAAVGQTGAMRARDRFGWDVLAPAAEAAHAGAIAARRRA